MPLPGVDTEASVAPRHSVRVTPWSGWLAGSAGAIDDERIREIDWWRRPGGRRQPGRGAAQATGVDHHVPFGPIQTAPANVPYSVRRIGAPVEQLSDEALLAGFAAADPELATAFVRRFQAKVFGMAVHVVGDTRTAEDVAQSAFERAWRHARTYDPRRGSVSGWLGVIARNLAIDTVRVRPVMPVDPAALLSQYVDDRQTAPGPEQAAVDLEAADDLRNALRCLAPEHARAVVLAGIGGFSASQVAQSEGIPLGTAKTRIRTGLLRLRARLQEARTEHA
jgi:RNA polymerase sigma factor (sigma-70 family)